MSVSLAAVADALIEFILSLLRDPAAAAEFAEEPDAALGARGLSNVGYEDVCAVAPVVMEKAAGTAMSPSPVRPPVDPVTPPTPAVREILNIVNNLAYVDDRDTIVDQSVNQNIWAGGDVTQIFDNEAVVSTGDSSIAAGDDVSFEENYDLSTNITAGDDAVLGDQTTTTNVAVESFNTDTDTTTTTTTTVTDSANDASTTTTINDSFTQDSNDTVTTDTNVDVDANVVYDSEETLIDSSSDGEF
ncbi:IniB N-terminal domain-containing protein [Microbacterium sp. GXF7504]